MRRLAKKGNMNQRIDVVLRKFRSRMSSYPPGMCPLVLYRSLLQISMNQSCGKCVPCRDGLVEVDRLLGKILGGDGTPQTVEEMRGLCRMIEETADCAVGVTAAKTVLDSLEEFADEYASHIRDRRCIENVTQTVPCMTLCPAHVNVPGYISLIAARDYAGAVNMIRDRNPFPTACAMICEHPCEQKCRRSIIDAPLNIRGLKKYAVDMVNADEVATPAPNVPTGKKIAVIGSGPSGLTCAWFLALMGHKVVVFEEHEKPGGMLRYGIPQYRLPKEKLDRDIRAILAAGDIELRCGVKIGRETGGGSSAGAADPAGAAGYTDSNSSAGPVNSEGSARPVDSADSAGSFLAESGGDSNKNKNDGLSATPSFTDLRKEFDAVYLGIGAQIGNRVPMENADAENVVPAADFLQAAAEGHPMDLKGKKVVLIGGGNVAMDAARTAVRLGAESIHVFTRKRDDITALASEMESAMQEGVRFRTLLSFLNIETDKETGKVCAVWLQPQIVGEYDRMGMMTTEHSSRYPYRFKCDVLILGVGQRSDVAAFEAAGIPVSGGRIDADESCMVRGWDGVFSGGDCVTGPSTAINAVAAGQVAAFNIDEYLGYHHKVRCDVTAPPAMPNPCIPTGRAEIEETDPFVRKMNFDEVEIPMTPEEAMREAGRCLRCDHYGCGAMAGGTLPFEG